MDKDNLIARLDIILGTEVKTVADAANTLRGALIRLAQAYDDPEVSERVDKIWRRTCEITGI